jgi:hypothetical protein
MRPTRSLGVLGTLMIAFVAAPVQSADVIDPEMMADAIRNTGNQCNKVTSMEQGKDPSKGEDYEVVCDDDIKYTVRWQEDDTALIVGGES